MGQGRAVVRVAEPGDMGGALVPGLGAEGGAQPVVDYGQGGRVVALRGAVEAREEGGVVKALDRVGDRRAARGKKNGKD